MWLWLMYFLSAALEINSSVTQCGILSPLFFVMVNDYVMRWVAEKIKLELS